MRNQTRLPITALLTTTALLFSLSTSAEWNRFRGPNGSGTIESSSLPTEFGPDKNMLWNVDVPKGSSSPIVVGDRIVLTAEDHHLMVICVDAKNGDLLWNQKLVRARDGKIHVQTDSAVPTPVADDKNVYLFFQELGLVKYSLDGEHQWTLPLGPFNQFYGMAGSPVLSKNLVIIQCDQQTGSFLMAIDKESGKIAWQVDRGTKGAAWSTPILFPTDETAEIVVVHGKGWLDAYTLSDGTSVWSRSGMGAGPITSPFLVGNTLFLSAPQWSSHDDENPFLQPLDGFLKQFDKDANKAVSFAEMKGTPFEAEFGWLDIDKDGSVSVAEYEEAYREMFTENYGISALDLNYSDAQVESSVRWQFQEMLPEISTPLLYQGTVFFADKKGYVNSLNGNTGTLVKRERVKGTGAQFFASPIGADGKVYLASLNGNVVVIDANEKWNVLATNKVGKKLRATPAIYNNTLIIRTVDTLYAFGKK